MSAISSPSLSRHLVPVAAAAPADVRCNCGNLLAMFKDQGLEMKCRRCKRLIRLKVVSQGAGTVTLRIEADDCHCPQSCACAEHVLGNEGTGTLEH